MDQHTLTIGTGVITVLCAAVGTLWKYVMAKAEKCERKHEDTQCELLKVTKEVGELKGKVDLAVQVSPRMRKIEDIAEETLEEIKKINEQPPRSS